ncbi:uncharacterized protein LOC129952740 [Eupeodes corollae]|uniref:uncharacterized protein LOC129952740 n=1 Tax=Eupeodes corollae TaxID=290404 RepID=UPI002492FA46|nr:uncharacterized protein LOC129952740 [Eupeodes corollae]
MHHNKIRYKILLSYGQRSSLIVLIVMSLLTVSVNRSLVSASRYNRQNHVMYSGGSSSSSSSSDVGDRGIGVGRHGHNRNSNNNHNDVYSVNDAMLLPPIMNPNDDNPLIVNQQQLSSCQTVCACKWKGGKQTVECIDRSLIQIPESIDPSTQVLDMSGNKLQTLSNEQFIRANLLNLQKLYLRNCKIGEIEPETFKGLTNLVELDLSHNLLVVVPSNALGFIPSLRDLTLASNHIHKIEAYSFGNTQSLQKLDLSHCDIQTLAPQAFEGLESLTQLKLNGNRLGELRPKTIETLSKLHGIELHDNPWMCDCRLRAAKLWLLQNNIPYPVAPTCSGGPERVLDRSFADLQVDDFACRPEMLPINHYVEATMGENASIVCRASAIPAATINWYWSGRLLANGSAFSAYQRVYIYEDGQFEKRSRLILTNAQETDSSEFYCVAENKAGTAEANFTLHVSMRAAGMASLGSGQIVGLSAALVILILFIFLIIMFLLLRLRRTPFIESKTPNHLEVITTMNHQNSITNKTQPPTGNGNIGGVVIANGAIPNCATLDRKGSVNDRMHAESNDTNPVQKPPRLTDLAYSTSNYDNNGSVLSTATCFISPTASAGNNPDLINDTKRFGSDEFADLKIPAILTANSSGEYSRAGGCDSLYPSGLWETATTSSSATDDLYLKRATSTTISGYTGYSDKTPIMETNQLYDLHERTTDYFSKTFPRTHFNNAPSTSSSMMVGQGAHSTTSTTTTNLSSGGNSTCGYPSDYGLPLVPGAETQIHHTMHPIYNNNNATSAMTSTSCSNINNNGSNSSTRSSTTPAPVTHQQPLTNLSGTQQQHQLLANGVPVNAKTIRVWQKGGVPVLPPVTALKRALISSSRSSPDEGYQEGCGTDV